MFRFGSHGQGMLQITELGLAFLLSALIGIERELRRKSAGLRTYTIVGVSAALFLLISKYGFDNVLVPGHVELDPSRVAAQIVTGIGFMGAGLIFVQGTFVRGLTTAATVWLVTAIGMACGAGLLVLATATTVLYFIIALGFPVLLRLLPGRPSAAEQSELEHND
jgi:putative Mg2+ transporter-C (MgtC) family protein